MLVAAEQVESAAVQSQRRASAVRLQQPDALERILAQVAHALADE